MSVFFFPGQGSQTPGMGADFYRDSQAARAVFDAAAEQLGRDLIDIMFHGPSDALTDTRRAQPALVLCGIAIAAHLAASNVRPTACAGHSVGEIAALAVAGALATNDALAITVERARLMAETAAPGGMAAVLGLAPDAIQATLPTGVEIANYNGPQQTIIAGQQDALDAAIDALKAAGAKRVLPLRVSGPFHSSYMQPAADAFREVVADIPLNLPQVRFVSSV
ncbi:MAG: ACP S-malonyltransferase, partial [Candidatus Hydrogenedentales bacterium]